MPDVKFTKVLSCSSEDKNHPAENLLRPQSSYKKWKCKPGEKRATVILQLERAIKFQSIDIGNESSAFIEILVGRSSTSSIGGGNNQDDDYAVLIPTAGFMTPDECRKGTNLNGVRFFDFDKLTKESREEKWDRMKIICTQPFNPDMPFGLSFVKIHASVPAVSVAAVAVDKVEGNTASGTTSNVKRIGKFAFKEDVDECGVSNTVRRGMAPGALFLSAQQKAERSDDSNVEQPRRRNNDHASADDGYTKMKQTPKTRKMTPSKKSSDSVGANGKSKESNPPAAGTSTTPKRKLDSPDRKASASASTAAAEGPSSRTSKTKPIEKSAPFSKLLDGVVFVLSGFQNPLRSELRDRATEMGAQYRADWTKGCTHLVCAFINTPKYNQVKGKGKIVKREWILDSYKRQTRLDWKKYSFEETDESSEDEIVAEDSNKDSRAGRSTSLSSGDKASKGGKSPKKSKTSESDFDPYNAPTDYSGHSSSPSGYNTDEEIARVREAKRRKKTGQHDATDQKQDSSSPAQNSVNNEQQANSGGELPELPDCFHNFHFFLYGGFPNADRKQLNRYIVALGGVVAQYMTEKVTHVLTREQWDDSFNEASTEFPKIIFLQPDFVLECGKKMAMVNMEEYRVKK